MLLGGKGGADIQLPPPSPGLGVVVVVVGKESARSERQESLLDTQGNKPMPTKTTPKEYIEGPIMEDLKKKIGFKGSVLPFSSLFVHLDKQRS